ncbi:secreted salivary gland peptide, putative [Ixodes scapularis]|uniref:Secreted salivary gland peptide, putative n=1 Tax=Ixodes scapularis TaxID=6945 RepID=B7PIN5_IXOSC|nr:secreted salivary gland peptide, putative [Ixodes scapularis]|eukprot:XP_002405569.1 secreted salivary gland peptide, putative [Ixodes scapularis]
MFKTGRSFSITANQKMIAALLVLVHSLQITSAGNPKIKGDFRSLSPRCEEKAKDYIKKRFPDLLEATLQLRQCDFFYVRQPSTGPRIQGEYALPDGFPCAFGSTCRDGVCECSACE